MANDQFDITDQEQQFLKILRDWNTISQDFQVMIEHAHGAWDITMKAIGAPRLARGTGATFDEAWGHIKLSWLHEP